MTKEIIIIALIIVIIYLAYQQNNLDNSSDNSAQIEALQTELKHYQSLYQKRVNQDLGYEASELQQLQTQITQLQQTSTNWEKNYQQLNKEFRAWQQTYQNNLQILTQLAQFHSLVEKSDSHSLDRSQVNQAESLVEQITQSEIKQLASWMVTDSAFILGHNNLLTKLADQEDKNQESREQLSKINILFTNQELVDFNQLYSLLQKLVEKEKERNNFSLGSWKWK